MKIKSIEVIHHDTPIPVYDIVTDSPLHNYIVQGGDAFVVSHNCNFAQAGIKDVFKAKARMKSAYDTLYARVAGTFRKHGRIYGKLFACSSRNSDQDFLESHITDQTKIGLGNRIMISGAPQWEVLPAGTFSDGTFSVAIGDRYRRPFIIEDDSLPAVTDLITQGYQIIHPPLDMKPEFISDIDIALRDLAGISITGSLSFITQATIDACISPTRQNPFLNDILQIGINDNLTIEQFFHFELVDPAYIHSPMYIHLDLSTITDRTGITGVSPTGKVQQEDMDGKKIVLPFLTHMFSVAIQAPKGDRIPYNKILEFIIWLRRKGFNIYLITRDQFQSDYMGQLLEAQGFKVGKISLDRTADGYVTTRSVMQEQRINMLHSPELESELVQLQRDSTNGHIDHQVGGWKDLADSFAGATWQASNGNPGPQVSITSNAHIIAAVNHSRIMPNVQNDAASALHNLQQNMLRNAPTPPSTLSRTGRRPGIIIPKR